MFPLKICLFCILLAASPVFAEFVTLENTAGKSIEVELIGLIDGEVEFRMRNGQKYKIPIDTLSPSSQTKVLAWAEEANKVVLLPEDRVKVTLHTRRDSDDTDGGYTGWKDMDERIHPRVIVKNDEFRRGFKNLTATLVLFGENVVDRNDLKVVFKDTFKFDLPKDDEYVWSGKPFNLDYLVDDNDGHDDSYGYRYRYYFIVIENEDGSIGHSAASFSSWAKTPRMIRALSLNGKYPRSLR